MTDLPGASADAPAPVDVRAHRSPRSLARRAPLMSSPTIGHRRQAELLGWPA